MPTHPFSDATAILGNPERHAGSPEVFQTAWAELKAQRGQDMRAANLPGSLHDIRPSRSIIETVREIAHRKGYKLARPRPVPGDRRA
ncbi:MAG: hypothetical protein EpisKO_15770 [Epibacterium sp.]